MTHAGDAVIAVLCHILVDDKLLLIRKRRGFGAGLLNGPGGRVEEGEGVYEAALREVKEELNVTPIRPEPAGVIRFEFVDEEVPDWVIFVFISRDLVGAPSPTDEAEPRWTPIDEIPYEEMWDDDRIWLPLMLRGVKFVARFLFDLKHNRVLDYELRAVTRRELEEIFHNPKATTNSEFRPC